MLCGKYSTGHLWVSSFKENSRFMAKIKVKLEEVWVFEWFLVPKIQYDGRKWGPCPHLFASITIVFPVFCFCFLTSRISLCQVICVWLISHIGHAFRITLGWEVHKFQKFITISNSKKFGEIFFFFWSLGKKCLGPAIVGFFHIVN